MTPARRGADRAARLVVALAVSLVSLSACSADNGSIADEARSGNRQGYVSGDGSIETIAAAKRGRPVELSGETLDGDAWSTADARGKVVVLNVWATWCPPCEAEAPELKKAAEAVAADGKPVVFMGINTRDNAASGRATIKRQGIPYPSLDDREGLMVLALQGKAPTPPTTLVLDRQGRIASRVVGEVTAPTLTGLVDDALAEK